MAALIISISAPLLCLAINVRKINLNNRYLNFRTPTLTKMLSKSSKHWGHGLCETLSSLTGASTTKTRQDRGIFHPTSNDFRKFGRSTQKDNPPWEFPSDNSESVRLGSPAAQVISSTVCRGKAEDIGKFWLKTLEADWKSSAWQTDRKYPTCPDWRESLDSHSDADAQKSKSWKARFAPAGFLPCCSDWLQIRASIFYFIRSFQNAFCIKISIKHREKGTF